MSEYHTSVLLNETITYLNIEKGKRFIDATLGGGGHAFEIVARGGIVLGIDTDKDAIDYVVKKCKGKGKLTLVKGNFRNIDMIARDNGFENVSGILMDLGVSSFQLDTSERGFSFQRTGQLDMRMDQELGVTAKDLLAALSKGELYKLFTTYGEERFARIIADSIVKSRKLKPIETTTELSEIISRAVPRGKEGIHPATRVFQALRIAVNAELDNLRISLPKAIDLLAPGGRLCVISFHSLEDRIVKTTFLEMERRERGKMVTKKPIIAHEMEKEENMRARSAKLRVFERKPL